MTHHEVLQWCCCVFAGVIGGFFAYTPIPTVIITESHNAVLHRRLFLPNRMYGHVVDGIQRLLYQ